MRSEYANKSGLPVDMVCNMVYYCIVFDICVTPAEEIEESALAEIEAGDPLVACPKCGHLNDLAEDFWELVSGHGFNNIPGLCLECRSLFTMRVLEPALEAPELLGTIVPWLAELAEMDNLDFILEKEN